MTTPSPESQSDDSGFFIPLARGETAADREAEIVRERAERLTVHPDHANLRGYVFDQQKQSHGVDGPEYLFRLVASNGLDYVGADGDISASSIRAAHRPGAMITFSASSHRLVREIHEILQPESARIVGYDLAQKAWVAEDKANNRRFRFSTQESGQFVHGPIWHTRFGGPDKLSSRPAG